MADNRRSLSPSTRVYSELQQILTAEQFDCIFPLINSAVASNETDDEEMARQEQERFYTVDSMEIDQSYPDVAPPFSAQQKADIDADAAFARQLQEEEYSRRSLPSSRPYVHETNDKNAPYVVLEPDNTPVLTDAEIAAHLQVEENQRGRRHRQRPTSSTHQTNNRPVQSNEPRNMPFPRATLARPTPPNRNHYNNTNNVANLFQVVAAAAAAATFPHPGARAYRDVQHSTEDFGPNDYERLLELDNNVGANPLTKDQINLLPTEKFHCPKNKTDEENKCSICWDDFEQNQILRRLRCFHLYHRDCIDVWLKDKNQCPICRISAIQ